MERKARARFFVGMVTYLAIAACNGGGDPDLIGIWEFQGIFPKPLKDTDKMSKSEIDVYRAVWSGLWEDLAGRGLFFPPISDRDLNLRIYKGNRWTSDNGRGGAWRIHGNRLTFTGGRSFSAPYFVKVYNSGTRRRRGELTLYLDGNRVMDILYRHNRALADTLRNPDDWVFEVSLSWDRLLTLKELKE